MKMGELTIEAIRKFTEDHNPVNAAYYNKTVRGKEDSGLSRFIRYLDAEAQNTGIYGLLEGWDCHCPCGAGGRQISVFRLKNAENVENIIRYMKQNKAFPQNEKFPYILNTPEMEENPYSTQYPRLPLLFHIEAKQTGDPRRMEIVDRIGKIDGQYYDYNLAKELIHALS